jgi:hypothetical protein
MTDRVTLLFRFTLYAVLFVGLFAGLGWMQGLWVIGEDFWIGCAAVLVVLLLLFLAMAQATMWLLGDPGGWAPQERKLKEGVATLYWRGDVSTGLLTLTDRRLRFSPHRFNATEGDYSFAVRSVASTSPTAFPQSMLCNLRVHLSDGRERCFAVIGKRAWRDAITQAAGAPPL